VLQLGVTRYGIKTVVDLTPTEMGRWASRSSSAASAIRDQLDTLLDEAARRRLTLREALAFLYQREAARKDERRIDMATKIAHFPRCANWTRRVRQSRSSDTQVTIGLMKRYNNLSETCARTCTGHRTRIGAGVSDQIAATDRSCTNVSCLRLTGPHLRDEPNMIRRPLRS
jgi:hypothetical protein